jgi:hypothetical protein
MKTRVQKRKTEPAEPNLTEYRRLRETLRVGPAELELRVRKGELVEKIVVKRFLVERARMERDQWLTWASAASARLAASLGVDHAQLFASLEQEVRSQLGFLSEKPLET